MLNVLLIPKWKGRFFLEEEAKMEFLAMSQKNLAVQKNMPCKPRRESLPLC